MSMFFLYNWDARFVIPEAPAVEASNGEQAIEMFKGMGYLIPVVGLHPVDEARRRQRLEEYMQ